MQPRKGHSKQASPLRTDPPKTKGNSLRKSDSQLYSTAPTLLSHSINSTNDTYHLSLSLSTEHSTPTHTQQSCRQAKCKRSWRCPASSSRTALNSSTAARMSCLCLSFSLPLLPLLLLLWSTLRYNANHSTHTVSPTSANSSRSARPSVSVSSSWALSVTLSS
jgi:hypothetical protein